MKRQRGRGRGGKPGGGGHHNHHQNPNRSLESSGPENFKARGPAAHVYERYLQAARDASASGDRVMAENFLQHAEHYYRVLRAMQPAMPPPQQNRDQFGVPGEPEFDGEEGGEDSVESNAGEGEMAEGGDQPDVEFPGAQQQQPQQGQGGDREGGEFRGRRRGRRNRYRPEGGGDREGGGDEPREGQASGERGDRPERGERQDRPPRQPRERSGDGEQAGPEGFSSGPKPAFLRSE